MEQLKDRLYGPVFKKICRFVWQDKIQAVNREYHQIFFISSINHSICRFVYPIRNVFSGRWKLQNSFVIDLPQKYFYSSGLNCRNGYRKPSLAF